MKEIAIKYGRMLKSDWNETGPSIKYRLSSLIGQ